MTAKITVFEHELDVDIRDELEQFNWKRAEWSDDKLIAASPFRYDNHPSFYVYLSDTTTASAGSWGDSGAQDPAWSRGGLIRLLAFLRMETTYETCEYLLDKYGKITSADELTLDSIKLRIPKRSIPLDESILIPYKWRHSYLERRLITEDVQRLMRIGYDRDRHAITIPWYNPDGTLANVKFRSVNAKSFWYVKNGRPIRELVYGLNIVYERKIKRAAIVEAEIDAMTIMSCGVGAIANGSSDFNEYKAELIYKSPLEEVVIFADHDEPGQKFKRKVIELLSPYMAVKVAGFPYKYKDANEYAIECGLNRVRERIECAKMVRMRMNLTI